ncbi:Canalicular multispecific organic anion transporter 1 [Coemansia sp. RSA 2424]|nr:Canalicular multispecific organic anion transporter 1 [Coemansia sp. RSA 2424]
MDNCRFRWGKKASILKKVSLNATGGDLVAVVGKTGSGKSSLLLAMCKEMELTKGSGTVVGTVGYLEQSPWIMNDTMRANIIFGREFDEEYFWKVVHACALTQDMESWPEKDLTLIGERGINISGGQRARLALARTVYSRADVYILDDPLSAVDAHVKRHILDNVILSTGLLGGKLRVVTTHAKSMLPFCNQIITVGDNTVSVVHQKPKEHTCIAPVAAIAVAAASDPTPDEAESDITPATSAADGNAEVAVAEKAPAAISESAKEQALPEKHSFMSNARYVLNLCGWHIIGTVIITASFRPITRFILDGYNIAALKENAKSNTVSHDAVLWYLKICLLKSSHLTKYKVTSGEMNVLQSDLADMIYNIGSLVGIPSSLRRFSDKVSLFRQYSDIEPEGPYIIDDCRVPSEWPHSGNVEFKNLSVKYESSKDYVLKNLNVTIRPGEKIGIVGRTGAGKSTLAKAIFRLLNKNVGGSIEIDGHDTAQFGVGDFRPKLGIIPQESTMFDGTVKRNLDPLQEFTIEDMWAALIKCDVAKLIKTERKCKTIKLSGNAPSTSGGDDDDNDDESVDDDGEDEDEKADRIRWECAGSLMRVVLFMFAKRRSKCSKNRHTKTGINKHVGREDQRFSSGQRQLFSLCRLLMRKSKVLVLDEATAEVDLETDGKMQELIRNEFSDCTVLTIAHRLDTIMNSDRIIVMEKGEIAEIGPPQELIASGGMFAELVKANKF